MTFPLVMGVSLLAAAIFVAGFYVGWGRGWKARRDIVQAPWWRVEGW